MTKTSLLCGLFSALALTNFALGQSPPAGVTPPGAEPVHMTVDYGQNKRVVRESHGDEFSAVGIPLGRQVTVTFGFLPAFAGTTARIAVLDGGDLIFPATPLIAADGTYSFQFRAGNTPGFYRFGLSAVNEYHFTLYTFDPENPPGRAATR